MSKITLSNVGSLIDATTAATTINANNAVVQTAMDNTLSRDGTSPNTMSATLDMNSNQIINLPAPSTVNSPARLIDVVSNPTITIPGTGTSGHVVPFLDGVNTWSAVNTFQANNIFSGNNTFSGTTTIAGFPTLSGNNTFTGTNVLPGVLNNSRTAKTANYTVLSADNGVTFALGGSTLFTLTFGAAGTYPANFIVMVINEDTTRGKTIALSGGTNFILWPGQTCMVFNQNNVWKTNPQSQRWVAPSSVNLYVDTAGSDTNDGLVTGSGAFLTIQAAVNAAYTMDHRNGSPTIYPTAGQTFAGAVFIGGQLTGNNVLSITGNGGNFNWSSTVLCVDVGDNAELILTGINWLGNSSNTASQGHIYGHNNAIIDLIGSHIFTGAGANNNAIFLDGPSIISVANGFTVVGVFGDIVHFDAGGKGSFSGVLGISGAPTAARLFALNYCASALMGTQPTAAGYTSIGASTVKTNSVFNANGTTIPGGVTATTGGQSL